MYDGDYTLVMQMMYGDDVCVQSKPFFSHNTIQL